MKGSGSVISTIALPSPYLPHQQTQGPDDCTGGHLVAGRRLLIVRWYDAASEESKCRGSADGPTPA